MSANRQSNPGHKIGQIISPVIPARSPDSRLCFSMLVPPPPDEERRVGAARHGPRPATALAHQSPAGTESRAQPGSPQPALPVPAPLCRRGANSLRAAGVSTGTRGWLWVPPKVPLLYPPFSIAPRRAANSPPQLQTGTWGFLSVQINPHPAGKLRTSSVLVGNGNPQHGSTR